MMYLTILFTMTILVPATSGYSYGAPASACDSMSPIHGATAQTDASSYTITPTANTYDCDDTIDVTLSGANFMGFLCQARYNSSIYSTVGSLTNSDNSVQTTNNCPGEAALTHTEGGNKASFQFSWTHIGTSTDDIYIVCTVVQNRTTFWEKLTSSAITYSGAATVCNGTDSGNGSGNGSGTGPVISSVLLVFVLFMMSVLKGFM